MRPLPDRQVYRDPLHGQRGALVPHQGQEDLLPIHALPRGRGGGAPPPAHALGESPARLPAQRGGAPLQRQEPSHHAARRRPLRGHALRALRPRGGGARHGGQVGHAPHQDAPALRQPRFVQHAPWSPARAGHPPRHSQEDQTLRGADAARARPGHGDAPHFPARPLQAQAEHRQGLRQGAHGWTGRPILCERGLRAAHCPGAGARSAF
mmetsp:Transcript_1657/g.4841  ORF Transcript_1657/g.4841 Transcript_1657/m.4841 type:complete len:209 (+) Transcript_1657:833-1459(+)